jgi:Na+/H+ antiporter NhaD/arsenite permease-like protein
MIVFASIAFAALFGSSAAESDRAIVLARSLREIGVAVLFAATYLAVAIGRLPGSHLDRSGAAMAGAALMVAIGALSLGQARDSVDFNTLVLLLGMMILVAHLRLSGFFPAINNLVVGQAHRPLTLLIFIVAVAGVLSAFLVNDAVCLVLTPLVIELVRRLRLDPVPYLMAVAMASNIGGVATLTGNPQNMIIGGLSHIPYVTFAAVLTPVALVGLMVLVVNIAIAYRSQFFSGRRLSAELIPNAVSAAGPIRSNVTDCRHLNWPLIYKSLAVLAGTIVAFFSGVTPSLAAIVAGAILLIIGRVGSEDVYRKVDWTLLLMFAGLFIVVAGMERTLIGPSLFTAILSLQLERAPVLAAVTAVLSNLVSNVPAVLVLKPFVASLHDPQRAWLLVAMAATLAGNFTLLGSVANLIVVQVARADGITISFWDYFKIGAPLTIITIVIGLILVPLR